MDLIDDLQNDIAIAFLVDRRYGERIDPVQARDLIGKVVTELKRTSQTLRTRGLQRSFDSLSHSTASGNA